ncbi:YIP1 family protein [Salipiger sp. PrR002]|uniref:YIP1 family protein n=1 Tax=Salipiger sp. PrR002 TaxID=2706489 RepID=UPI0013B7DF56|nr:YIP1 family protein [Salipiger sp. PrR002]NDV97835.1 YIP1 family protein [Salipiger sp. PrR002]NDW55326.1 YIP1 family protein [Salipiger sp. PrR004]
MSAAALLSLAWQTIVAPREVARRLISLRLSREVLLTGFALVVVLNALIVGLMQLGGEVPAGMLLAPVPMGLLLATMLAATIAVMTWAGRTLGGSGRIEDVAVLLIWLQALRALAQLGVALLGAVSGGLALLVVLGSLIVGIWILVNFLDEAHGLGSPFKALLVLILASVALVLALMMIVSLLGVGPNGMAGYV